MKLPIAALQLSGPNLKLTDLQSPQTYTSVLSQNRHKCVRFIVSMPGYNSNVGSYRTDTIDNEGVVVLAGGVGGAKLVNGFAQVVPAGKLTVIVNTGDHFRHMGLAICPDLDAAMHTFAGGRARRRNGVGRAIAGALSINLSASAVQRG